MSLLSRINWSAALAPIAMAIFYAVAYRGLSSATNRTDLVISLKPGDLLSISRYYLLMGLYGLSKPLSDWFSLPERGLGVGYADDSWAFAFASLGTGLILWQGRKHNRQLWLIVFAGILCTGPYLAMQNRALIYYGLRLNMFVASFLALVYFTAGAGSRPEHGTRGGLNYGRAYDKGLIGIGLYTVGLAIASSQTLNGWNWAKHYGAMTKAAHQRFIARPEVAACSQARPCCVDFHGNGAYIWLYNTAAMNWNDGGRFPPRFLEPGSDCPGGNLSFDEPRIY